MTDATIQSTDVGAEAAPSRIAELEIALRERTKELTCLQELGRIVERSGLSREAVFGDIVNLLPATWLEPDLAVGRIRFDDESWTTGDFAECVAAQSADLVVDGSVRGSVEVGYTEVRAQRDEGPFLKEERALVDAIAERLGHIAGRLEAESALKIERESLRAVLDAIDEVIYVADPDDYELLHGNAVMEASWGTDWRGKKCYEFLQDRDEPCPFCTNDRIFGDNIGKPHVWEFQNEVNQRWYRCTDKAIRWTDGRMVRFELAMDITELKNTQFELVEHREKLEETVAARTAELSRTTEVASGMNRIFRDALHCETEEDVAKAALKVAEEVTGASFGFIGLVNEEGTFDTIGLSNPGWDACAMPGGQATMMIRGMVLRGIWSSVVKTGESRISNDPGGEADKVGTPEGHPPLTSFLGVPLKRGAETVGMIALGNKPDGFVPEDIAAMETMANAFHEVLLRKRMEVELREQSAIKAAQSELSDRLLGDQNVEQLSGSILSFLCGWLRAPIGALHVRTDRETFRFAAGFAHEPPSGSPREWASGEGLVGQAAAERREIALTDVPEDYFPIRSALGQTRPRHLYVRPMVHEGRTLAVIELGALEELDWVHRAFLEAASDTVCIAIQTALIRQRQQELLEETQRQSEELQAQQEELTAANEELEEHNRRLKDNDEELRAQQEELQVTNEELEEKTELLQQQRDDVERARRELADKAQALARASKYKSEFLSNMSHELRTPLNSLLLLARSLKENRDGNLTAEQVESATVIHTSGTDLLTLINEILDLSKIEAGRMRLDLAEVRIRELADAVISGFRPQVEAKGLDLDVEVEDDVPQTIRTDRTRLHQILKNLVDNAVKFTEEGSVSVVFRRASQEDRLAVVVRDSGIGIHPEHQALIFEAFQQVDGGTSRRYGGTGLGLSITRELVSLLGGDISLESEPDRGSTFTIVLPIRLDGDDRPVASEASGAAVPKDEAAGIAHSPRRVPDDREQIGQQDRAVVIIEDDDGFAGIVADLCRGRGLKVLVAPSGEEGIDLVRQFRPEGVILDLGLPGMDGWKVLDLLKEDSDLRHIPVHMISADEPTPRALRKGAVGYLQKPVTQEQIDQALERIETTASRDRARVLVVEDDPLMRQGIVDLIAEATVEVDQAEGGVQAMELLRSKSYDCMILDLGLMDFDGDELLRRASGDDGIDLPPVIIHTSRDLSWEENIDLRAYSDAIIIKDVRSHERLLDEVSLFLHQVVADMPETKRQVITNLHDTDVLLRGKTVLVVDDDMRALFALSRLLSEREMKVLKADNGEKALEILEAEDGIDIVLMDIMMPVLDGYETMRRLRANPKLAQMPVIALTAKAMKGDQDKCIEAGASDYLPKPVDQDRLISMLRVWLYR
jgi:signal transduction histidine kinase/DNA-binding response OmpR family regulator/GAF domain-containing protein